MRIRSLSLSCMSFSRPTLSLMLASALLMAGCATQAPRHKAGISNAGAASATAPSDPPKWVGRWQGAGAASLTILPGTDERYQIDRRNKQGVVSHYRATAAGGRLYFKRLGQTLAIRPGRGSDTGEAALANLSDCLQIEPDGVGYCRRANSADALPLAHGAYVKVKTRCPAAQRADTLFFTGRGIARPGQNACQAALVSQQGMIFHLHDSCAAGGGAGSRANETISVPDTHHMAVATNKQPVALYRYCATGLLPPSLQTIQRR